MGPRARFELSADPVSRQQEISRLAAQAEVRSAFSWFRSQELRFAQWQLDLAAIPAPPFGESARSEWLARKFEELDLEDVHSDEVGNVFGTDPGPGSVFVSLSAH